MISLNINVDGCAKEISIDDLIDIIADKISNNRRIIIEPESMQAQLLIHIILNELQDDDETNGHPTL